MFFINQFLFCVTDEIICYGGSNDGKSLKKADRGDWVIQSHNDEYDFYHLQHKDNEKELFKFLHIIAVPKGFEWGNQENIVSDMEKQIKLSKEYMGNFI